jgi:hypothetical protein
MRRRGADRDGMESRRPGPRGPRPETGGSAAAQRTTEARISPRAAASRRACSRGGPHPMRHGRGSVFSHVDKTITPDKSRPFKVTSEPAPCLPSRRRRARTTHICAPLWPFAHTRPRPHDSRGAARCASGPFGCAFVFELRGVCEPLARALQRAGRAMNAAHRSQDCRKHAMRAAASMERAPDPCTRVLPVSRAVSCVLAHAPPAPLRDRKRCAQRLGRCDAVAFSAPEPPGRPPRTLAGLRARLCPAGGPQL